MIVNTNIRKNSTDLVSEYSDVFICENGKEIYSKTARNGPRYLPNHSILTSSPNVSKNGKMSKNG